jgi:hypothetical protein
MNLAGSFSFVVRSTLLGALLALPMLSSPGCAGSSDDASAGVPTEEVKNGRVYRLANGRVENQIKAREEAKAKSVKKGGK